MTKVTRLVPAAIAALALAAVLASTAGSANGLARHEPGRGEGEGVSAPATEASKPAIVRALGSGAVSAPSAEADMPQLVGLNRRPALRALEGIGVFDVRVVRAPSIVQDGKAGWIRGEVLRQTPRPGLRIAPGSRVRLVVG